VTVVRLLEEKLFDPPRPVDIQHDGAWWPGVQRSWRLCDDHRGWMAEVEYVVEHEWGLGKYIPLVTPERIRIPDPAS
jgi:hypothetical protein